MRVAIIGLGNQGRKRLNVAGDDAVLSIDPLADDAQFSDLDQVDTDAFDAALVCTPDAAKLKILENLLRRGKPVLVEKPLLSTDPRALQTLQALATEQAVVCYTAYNHRFEPHIARLRQLLAARELGPIYSMRLFYGNGTARDVRQSVWRDSGMGVLADLGSHLLDMVDFLLDERPRSFQTWQLSRFENRAWDHALIGTVEGTALSLEMTLLSWRNSFRLDVIGELGSAHIDGLCKWGPSELVVRRRTLPSGKPDEKRYVLECADPTWSLEYQHFSGLCRDGGHEGLAKDIWINDVLHQVASQVV